MRHQVGGRFVAPMLSTALLAALLTVLGACASGDKATLPVAQPLIKATGKESVTVTLEQSGAAIELGTDQELIVHLAIDAAGRNDWSLVDLVPGVLTASGPKFERDLRTMNDGESTGSSIWHLRPVAPGNVTLRFELRRPRSLEPARQVLTYAVTVR